MSAEGEQSAEKAQIEPPENESEAFKRGWADGLANREPDFESLALGANRFNDYERGYVDSGAAEREARRG